MLSTTMTLETLGRLAALRHIAAKDRDRPPEAGIRLELAEQEITGTATDLFSAAQWRGLELPGPLGRRIDGIFDAGDLAASYAAFRARMPAEADGEEAVVRVAVTIEGTVTEGALRLELMPEISGQPRLELDTEDERPPATYTVRRWSLADYPNLDRIIEQLKRRSSEPAIVSGKRLTALTKTIATADPELMLEHYGTRAPIRVTSPSRPQWRGLLAQLAGTS